MLPTQKAHQIIETAYMAATTAIFWIALYYLPVGGPVFRLALPLPLVLLQLRHGQCVLEGVMVNCLLLIALMGPVRGCLVLFPYTSLAVWLGWGWKNRLNWWLTWGIGIFIGLMGFLIRLNVLSLLLGENLWSVVIHSTIDFFEHTFNFLQIDHIPNVLEIQIMTIGLILFQNLLYVFSLHAIAYWIFPRLNVRISEPPRLVAALMQFGDM
ncbi:hypothetical protein PMYN1_Chma670 (chromatophore) [Paulinella micropora]|uniref:DUF2232 domain-containing protein n=1 Tax=Paulinella micropora TaxID=1928728 RepID=A0A1L5YCR2_9EUKA|nr:hypothetical protein PCKR_725 [Paulinella micropora]AQX45257.1 hypothetical protein PFK_725 [Paulinella micropora]BBL86475.1 hypothetical protein PMYN1_Chma670 [Paulinella micropora]